MGSRAERRRQAKEDRRLLASGLDMDRGWTAQVAALMRVLHDLLEEARDAGTVAPLMGFLHAQMRASDRRAPKNAIACRKFCAHCCHSWVSARAPEVLFAAASAPAGAVEAVAAAHALTGPLDADARAGHPSPCPLLGADNLCTIYDARPSVCRTAVSQSVRICERAYAPGGEEVAIPTPDFYVDLRGGYALALGGALKRAGFPALAYEYNGALAAALARPDSEAAWLAGEPVFADVRTDPNGDPFEKPNNRKLYETAWASPG